MFLRGASGSSIISARLFACGGISENKSEGETSFPSQVYFVGIFVPCSNALLVIFIIFVFN